MKRKQPEESTSGKGKEKTKRGKGLEIAGLTEAEGREARNKLVDASLLRMLDRDRQRFQLHALLREELHSTM